jgi:hypothetical protein
MGTAWGAAIIKLFLLYVLFFIEFK